MEKIFSIELTFFDFIMSFGFGYKSFVIIGILIIATVAVWRFIKYKFLDKSYEISKLQLKLGGGTLHMTPSAEDKVMAYKIWVEISTRKIGLEIDLENDVIADIYKSWYEFFSITREHIKEMPYKKFKNKESQKIIELSINILNEGLRPHLTKWHARFNRWYDARYEIHNKNIEKEIKTPQQIQTEYELYNELSQDLLEVNSALMEYRKILRKMAFGEKM